LLIWHNPFSTLTSRRHVVRVGALPPKMPIHYGPSINLENAKKAVALALAEARKNNWTMAAAIVDGAGNLVYFEKMDNTQIGSVNVAIEKARSAALFKRPIKAFEDALASGAGGLRVLGVHCAVPIEGGIPLLIDGNIVGAIGISGETSQQDGQCAKAATDDLK
jgi:glc operon protein GlcG